MAPYATWSARQELVDAQLLRARHERLELRPRRIVGAGHEGRQKCRERRRSAAVLADDVGQQISHGVALLDDAVDRLPHGDGLDELVEELPVAADDVDLRVPERLGQNVS